jgi:hypothetical protein
MIAAARSLDARFRAGKKKPLKCDRRIITESKNPRKRSEKEEWE